MANEMEGGFWPMAITKEGEKLHTYNSFANGIDAM